MDSQVNDNEAILKIDYNEIPVTDMEAAKAFYAGAFGWSFIDFGPAYAAFENAGLDGGLRLEDKPFAVGCLIILKAKDILAAEVRVEEAGGTIINREDFPVVAVSISPIPAAMSWPSGRPMENMIPPLPWTPPTIRTNDNVRP